MGAWSWMIGDMIWLMFRAEKWWLTDGSHNSTVARANNNVEKTLPYLNTYP